MPRCIFLYTKKGCDALRDVTLSSHITLATIPDRSSYDRGRSSSPGPIPGGLLNRICVNCRKIDDRSLLILKSFARSYILVVSSLCDK